MREQYRFLRLILPVTLIGCVILPTLVFITLHRGAPAPPTPKYVNVSYSEEFVVPASRRVTVKVKAKNLNVLDVSFVLPEGAPVNVTVASLKYPPVPTPTEEYYVLEYIDIIIFDKESGRELHPRGTIYFKVPKSWIEGYDPHSVVMLEYRGKWLPLETALVGKDNESYYYEAKTESFSVFAIAVKRIVSENCKKCHQNVAVELEFSPYHDFNCTFCHNGMSRDVRCVQCHPDVGNFSAHKKFVEWAKNSTLMTGTNEACIACHTYAKVPICNITYGRYMSFDYAWSTRKVEFTKVPTVSVRINYSKQYTTLNLSNRTPPKRNPWW